ncbi:FtsX-like permease family protein [Chloroflexus sp.]|uniref:FtsX-like permease family protein n=1 Tax=Chloroflexus sp. TaxID=1904827 RepID=UPI002ACD839B|nr:FtsX-like permease family protein [Chloroflexus sp.]
MLAPRWRKVIRDLRAAPTRTALVTLSIAVGVFAFGVILTTRAVIGRELQRSFLAIEPASATITTTAFDDDLVAAVERLPEVAVAEGRRVVPARIRIGPDRWEDALITVLPDDGIRRIGIVRPQAGAWPPPDRAILVERASLARARMVIGETVVVELPGVGERAMPVAGTIHDLSTPLAILTAQTFIYMTEDTLRWLGGPAGYNQLHLIVNGDRRDAAQIRTMARAVEQLLERSGHPIIQTYVPPPLQHPAEALLPVITVLMLIVGMLALIASSFLSINTISAILNQQTRQLGVMAAIGAGPRALAAMYMVTAALFGLLALALAVPAALLATQAFAGFLSGQLNIDLPWPLFSGEILLLQIVAGLAVPVLTALWPIRSALRRPVRALLSGETAPPPPPFAVTLLTRALGHVLRRPTLLALRNAFRQRARLARTLIALALGGSVLITVMTQRTSLFATLEASLAGQNYDLEVQLARSYRVERVAPLIASLPAVTHLESTRRAPAFPVRPDGTDGEELLLRALPADTAFFHPRIAAGRWLAGPGAREVVFSTNIRSKEPYLQVGDWVTLSINGNESQWRLVGLIEVFTPPTMPAQAYVDLTAFTAEQGGVGRTDTLRVATIGHDPASHAAAAAAIEQRLTAYGIDLRLIRTMSDERRILEERFNLATGAISIMALIIGAVGALGLTGTLSINVLERTREIGILRAIGASDDAIRELVVTEGLTIALLAWVAGVILSIPMSYALAYNFGMALLNIPLIWTYSFPAIWMWLGVVIIFALLSSVLPARAATRIAVREALAYE